MSWKKNKTFEDGSVANYHTIVLTVLDTGLLPAYDDQGNKIEDGAMSTVTVGHFLSKQFYDQNRGDKEKTLGKTNYSVPIELVFETQQLPGVVSPATRAYEYIKSMDPFWSDAEEVE